MTTSLKLQKHDRASEHQSETDTAFVVSEMLLVFNVCCFQETRLCLFAWISISCQFHFSTVRLKN